MADETTLEPPTRSPGKAPRIPAEDLVVEVVGRHAEGLLRLARRHSLCASDAEDAYQRGLEIFLRHSSRLDPERATSWLRTVIKHEAMAVRRSRQRDLAPAEYDFDTVEAVGSASPEDRVASFERVARSAEALGTLKPQEVRALWLRAQGNSYEEIQEQTGWTRTKVNRCLYEGRKAFLRRYAGIEAGDECRRWEPALSALVDGEATQEELVALRPHLRSCQACRAQVREMHRSTRSVAAVLPVGLAAAAGSGEAEAAAHAALRAWEALTAWMFERGALAIARTQAFFELLVASAGKGTAVVAAGAAIASGSAVVIQESGTGRPVDRPSGAATALVGATGDALASARRVAHQQEQRRTIARLRAQVSEAGSSGTVVGVGQQSPAVPAASEGVSVTQSQGSPAGEPPAAGAASEFGLE